MTWYPFEVYRSIYLHPSETDDCWPVKMSFALKVAVQTQSDLSPHSALSRRVWRWFYSSEAENWPLLAALEDRTDVHIIEVDEGHTLDRVLSHWAVDRSVGADVYVDTSHRREASLTRRPHARPAHPLLARLDRQQSILMTLMLKPKLSPTACTLFKIQLRFCHEHRC